MSLFDLTLGPNLHVAEHEHERPHLCILLEGALDSRVNSTTYRMQRGQAVFHPAGVLHSGIAGPRGCRVLTVGVDPDWLEEAARGEVLPGSIVELNRSSSQRSTVALRRELELELPCSTMAIEGEVLRIIAAAARAPGQNLRRAVDRALDLLHDDDAAPCSTVTAVAAVVGCSAARLSEAFRRKTGRTIGEYARELRVERAKALLQGDKPIVEIALECGYSDQPHCTRLFKQATGVTPGEYRRRLRWRGETETGIGP